jgi:DNA-binding XRE family transcriptional regulator
MAAHHPTPAREQYALEFGHRLRVTRIVLGVSEAEAADALGVTVRTYRKYEAGQSNTRLGGFQVLDFSETLGLGSWLTYGDGSKTCRHLTYRASGKVAIWTGKTPQTRRAEETIRKLMSP